MRAQYQKQVKYEVWKQDHPSVSDQSQLDLAGQERPQFTYASMTDRMGTSRSIFAVALFLTLPIGARGQDDSAAKKPTTLEKLTVLRLPHTAGLVPVYYSAGFEARALKYQKTIIA